MNFRVSDGELVVDFTPSTTPSYVGDFITEFSACEDELIGELVDAIEHEPKKGGFLGVSEKNWGSSPS